MVHNAVLISIVHQNDSYILGWVGQRVLLGFSVTYTASPDGLAVKNLPAMQELQETRVRSLGWEDPLEKGVPLTSVFLPGESHGQRSLLGYMAHRVTKSWTQTKF